MKKMTKLNIVKTVLSCGVKLSLLVFSTSILAAPPIPVLNIPVNNSNNRVPWNGTTEITNVFKDNIYFQWYSEGAVNYRFIISQNESFSGFVDLQGKSYCADNTCWTNDYLLTDDYLTRSVLLSGHKYYWAVRANNNTGYSELTKGSFTTAGNPETTPIYYFAPVDWSSIAYKDNNLFWKAGLAPKEFYLDPTSSKLVDAKGNCTWYVNGRLQQLGYDVSKLNNMTGMAKTWRDSAKKAGLVVDKKPTVGSILQTTAGAGGHIAVVEEILLDGSLKISESSYIDTNAYPQLKAWNFKYRTRIIEKNKIPGYNYIHVPKGSNSGLVITPAAGLNNIPVNPFDDANTRAAYDIVKGQVSGKVSQKFFEFVSDAEAFCLERVKILNSNSWTANNMSISKTERIALSRYYSDLAKEWKIYAKSIRNYSGLDKVGFSKFLRNLSLKVPAGAVIDGLIFKSEIDSQTSAYQDKYPGLNIAKPSYSGFLEHLIGGISLGLLEVDRTSYDMYDPIPNDQNSIIAWLGDMESVDNLFSGNYPSEWINGLSSPPRGFLQYLKIKNQALKDLTDGSNINWVENM